MRELGWEGRQFGRLTVLRFDPNSQRQSRWIVRCVCGKEKSVYAFSLLNGDSKSCGKGPCAGRGTHYKTGTRLFRIWMNMRARCHRATTPAFKDYGARGIRVCRAWNSDFSCFYRWAMNHGYQSDLTIERRNPNGHYTPRNCLWIPNSEQPKNRRNSVRIGGRTAQEIAKELGLTENAVYARVRRGWSLRKTLLPTKLARKTTA